MHSSRRLVFRSLQLSSRPVVSYHNSAVLFKQKRPRTNANHEPGKLKNVVKAPTVPTDHTEHNDQEKKWGPLLDQSHPRRKRYYRLMAGYIALIIASFTGFAVFKLFKFWEGFEISTIYLGKNSNFDGKLSGELQFPMQQIALIFNEIVIKSEEFPGTLSFEKKLEKARKLRDRFPQSIIPHILYSYIYWVENDIKNATKHVDLAHDLASKHPNENLPFIDLLPTHESLADIRLELDESLQELKSGTIWTIEKYVKTVGYINPVIMQSSIIKTKTGTVIIYNPLDFTQRQIEQINQIGNVVAVFIPSASQREFTAQAHAQWPGALLLGSDSVVKHGQPQLPWHRFLDTFPIGKDIVDGVSAFPIVASMQKEVLLYHKDTKTLIGPNEILIRNSVYSDNHSSKQPLSISDICRSIGNGLWRGRHTQPFGVPNSQIAWMKDPAEFQAQLNTFSGLPIDTIVFGHGGIVHHPDPNFFKSYFSWLKFASAGKLTAAKWLYDNNTYSLVFRSS